MSSTHFHEKMIIFHSRLTCSIRWAACLLLGTAIAAEPSSQPAPVDPGKGTVNDGGKFEPKADPGSAASAPDPAARIASLGITADQETIRIGEVELNRRTHTVSIPATVNMLEGSVEYLLVHEKGKIHESIFATRAKPEDIHIACLLAGWQAGDKPADIGIEVIWETNGPPRRHRADEMVAIARHHPQATDGRHIEKGPWHYIGSRMDAAGFAATREGSIIALISDPSALVGNPRSGRLDDTLHVPNRDLLPPREHPVRIVLNRSAKPEPPHTQP
jgi:hypothetical protein